MNSDYVLCRWGYEWKRKRGDDSGEKMARGSAEWEREPDELEYTRFVYYAYRKHTQKYTRWVHKYNSCKYLIDRIRNIVQATRHNDIRLQILFGYTSSCLLWL